ncbi:unnamed protein product, partial [Closterium sp. NIES-54]
AEPRCRAALLCRVALSCLPQLHCCRYYSAAAPVMASPSLLTFDAEGQAVDFDVWLDDLQLFLQCDSKDGLSLFDLTSGASTAPAADADSTVRSQWLTRDAAARLVVRSHLPSTERAHFSQYKSAKTLYNAVVVRYSSPATAALSRLMLPYLFPDLAAFATVTDLITHLRTSDTRYRVALPAEFCTHNHPPMYITLYYLVTRLPDTLRSVRDHFLSLCPTTLTVNLLEERLLAAETSITAIGAYRGDPRTPFFEGRSALRLLLVRGAAPACKTGARALEEVVGAAVVAVEAEEGMGVEVVAEVGASVAAVEVEVAVAVAGGVEEEAAAAEVELAEAELCSGDPSSSSALVRPRRPSSFCGGLHATQRCYGRLTDAWRAQFPDATEIPRWGDLLRSGVAIFDLDFDAILAAKDAVSLSAEGDYYVCVPPDPGIEAAALGARESAAPGARESAALGARESAALGAGESALSGTASAQVLHTFTLDSGASRSFFRDHTTLTPLSRPVAVSLADPSGGPVLARYSTVLPCPAAPSGSLSGLYLPSFSTNLVSGVDLQDAGVDQFTPASLRCAHNPPGQRACNPPLGSIGDHQWTSDTPPHWDARSAHTGIRTRDLRSDTMSESQPLDHWDKRACMASRVLVSGLPRSLPPIPPGPAPTCVPCVEGQQRVAPHSSEFPPTEAPLQTLHMDVWGPARVRGQGHERYFLLVVDDYSRYTTVFPLRSKGEVTEVLIDWIRVARLQLRERFSSDFPILRLHSDRGGEFSSDLLRAFCRAEGIRQTFTLPASPQQNGIAEHRIGMVMDVARTSMIHAAAPHFLWPFAFQYAAHQINLQPRVSLPETSPTLRWTGKVGDVSASRVWGSQAFVRDLSADKLSSRAVPCVFLGFPPDAPADAGGAGIVPAGSVGATRPRAFFVPLREQVLGLPPYSSPAPSLEYPLPVQSESQLQLTSPLPAPSPYVGPTGGLAERREPESHPASPVRTARTSRRVPRSRPSAVPGTHHMALRPSTAPQRVPLPSPPESSLPALAEPASDSLRAASPTVTRFLATVVTDPSFESTAASALVAELVDFAAHCRLDYAASLVAESESVCPPSVGAMDAEMASWKSTGTYVDEVPPPGVKIVSGMWIFRVKRPPGSPPVFKERFMARGFSQRQEVD